MAFLQKTWKDRVAEYINRRVLTKEDGTTELVSVERSEGTISQEGDAFSAANMNDLEQRIANEFSEQNKNLSVRYNAETDMIQILDNNGVWYDFQKAYIYDTPLYSYGNEYVDITGGWSNIKSRSVNFTKNADNMYSNNHATAYGGIGTTKIIDLTPFKTIKVVANVTGMYSNYGLDLNILDASKTQVSSGLYLNKTGLQTFTFDISSFNGKHYIEIGKPTANECRGYIYEVILGR